MSDTSYSDTDAIICECPRGCTVALPAHLEISDTAILLPSARLHLPECDSCPERMMPTILSPDTDPASMTKICPFVRKTHTHRNLVRHVCTCTLKETVGDVPGPAHQPDMISQPIPVDTAIDVQSPVSVDSEPDITIRHYPPGTTWSDEELGVIRVCKSTSEAYDRYVDIYGGLRNSNAVSQKWIKLQKRGELLRVGGKCVISSKATANAGAVGKIISFCDGKRAANVEISDAPLATYQYDVCLLIGRAV